jgi:hypothetical protein
MSGDVERSTRKPNRSCSKAIKGWWHGRTECRSPTGTTSTAPAIGFGQRYQSWGKPEKAAEWKKREIQKRGKILGSGTVPRDRVV